MNVQNVEIIVPKPITTTKVAIKLFVDFVY